MQAKTYVSAVSVPEAHLSMFDAFEIAWNRLVTTGHVDQVAIDAARRQLATAVMSAAESRKKPEQIAETALRSLGKA
jgi:hypothetical protein